MSVTVVGAASGVSDEALEAAMRAQLGHWFGYEATASWTFLRAYRIEYAQPVQTPPYSIEGRPEKVSDGVFVCGDHRGTATLNGAIEAGRRAAKAVTAMGKGH